MRVVQLNLNLFKLPSAATPNFSLSIFLGQVGSSRSQVNRQLSFWKFQPLTVFSLMHCKSLFSYMSPVWPAIWLEEGPVKILCGSGCHAGSFGLFDFWVCLDRPGNILVTLVQVSDLMMCVSLDVVMIWIHGSSKWIASWFGILINHPGPRVVQLCSFYDSNELICGHIKL